MESSREVSGSGEVSLPKKPTKLDKKTQVVQPSLKQVARNEQDVSRAAATPPGQGVLAREHRGKTLKDATAPATVQRTLGTSKATSTPPPSPRTRLPSPRSRTGGMVGNHYTYTDYRNDFLHIPIEVRICFLDYDKAKDKGSPKALIKLVDDLDKAYSKLEKKFLEGGAGGNELRDLEAAVLSLITIFDQKFKDSGSYAFVSAQEVCLTWINNLKEPIRQFVIKNLANTGRKKIDFSGVDEGVSGRLKQLRDEMALKAPNIFFPGREPQVKEGAA